MFKRRKPLSQWQRWRQFLWPREGWPRAFSYMWHRLVRQRGSAHSLALGLAAGAFVSASPLLGTHFFQAALRTWVGNPLSFPFIWVGTFNIGNFLLGRDSNMVAMPELSFGLFLDAPLSSLMPIIGPMMTGSIPLGLTFAVMTYYPSYWSIAAYQRRRQRILLRRQHAKAAPVAETQEES
ncbi:MAG: DUF2062 domain-containing protein [Rhodobiaceae bacterium]